MKAILILGLLSDPTIAAGSIERTGGYNRCLLDSVELAKNCNFPIVMICGSSKLRPAGKVILHSNCTLYRIPYENVNENVPAEIAASCGMVLQYIKDLLEENDIQPVLIHSFYWLSGQIAYIIKNENKIPYIHTVIDLAASKRLTKSNLYFPLQEKWETDFLNSADKVLAISNSEKEVLIREYGVQSERIVCLGRNVPSVLLCPDHDDYGNVDNTAVPLLDNIQNPSWWNRGAFTFIGRLYEVKGLLHIISAWAILWEKYHELTPPLWIVGGTPEQIKKKHCKYANIFPKLSDWELSEKIVWWGYLSARGISTVLLHTYALVMHSQYESGGRVVIEAMSAGRPVLATPNGFAKDMIRDWYNGFIIQFGDTFTLARRMEHFLLQPYLSSSMGNTAYETWKAHQNSWRYFDAQKYLYESYWSGREPLLLHDEPLVWPDDNIKQHRLCCYPFEGTGRDKLRTLLIECGVAISDFMQNEIRTIKCEQYPHEVWQLNLKGKPYWAVLLHSYMNLDCLWQKNIPPAVEWPKEWESIKIGVQNTAIVPLTLCHSNRPFFAIPIQNIRNKFLPDDVFAVLSCIYQFETAPLPKDNPLQEEPNDMDFPASKLLPDYELTALLEAKKVLEKFPCKRYAEAQPQAWFYGDIAEHSFCFDSNGNCRLLPSAQLKVGRLGQSAAHVIFCMWLAEPKLEALERCMKIARKLGYSTPAIAYWLILIQWKELCRCLIMENSSDFQKSVKDWYILLEQLKELHMILPN